MILEQLIDDAIIEMRYDPTALRGFIKKSLLHGVVENVAEQETTEIRLEFIAKTSEKIAIPARCERVNSLMIFLAIFVHSFALSLRVP